MAHSSHRVGRGLSALALPVALAGCHAAATELARPMDAAVTTRGRVIHLDCADHGAVTYAFQAGGQPYRSRAAMGPAACASAQVGDTVVVSYRPGDPASSEPLAPRAPHRTLTKNGWIAACSVLLVGAMAMLALRRPPR